MGKRGIAILSAIFLFAFMFSIMSVSALEADNVTIVTPGASGTLSGSSAVFNVTLVTGYEAENWTSIRIYLQSASLTANTTEALATAWITNTTDLMLNGTLDSTVFEDGNDYTFKAQLFNGTDYVNQTRTGITIDNTVPQTPTLSPATNTQNPQTSSTTQTFTATVTDANTTSCTYVIARGGASSGDDYISGSGTYSGSSCTFTKAFTSTTDNGDWQWYVTASDETNTSTSGSNTFSVQLPASNGGTGGTGGSGSGSSGGGYGWVWFIIGAVLVVVVIWVIIKWS